MTDLADLVHETATELMLDAARSVSWLQIKNAVGGLPEAADMDDDEFERMITAVSETIQTADISIDTKGM